MGDKDIRILVHILKHKILVIYIKIENENEKKCIFGDSRMPRRGTILVSKECLIRFASAQEICYLLDRYKPNKKTCAHPCELL